MRQVSFSFRTGDIDLVELPFPSSRAQHLIIATSASLMSVGTERMLLSFGKAGLLEKMRQQPDRVRDVLGKIRTDGLLSTLEAVRSKLDQPIGLGYCNVGTVLEVGEGVAGFCVGDRVVSNGSHAEIVRVPHTLCAKIPAAVNDEAAAFAVVSAIGLQGLRLAQPTLGEQFVVIGLGLIGLLTCQMLVAAGCKVIGCDFAADRLALARKFGVDALQLSDAADPVAFVQERTAGRGADGVLITASTDSNTPVQQAARMCRQRGRIVLIGVVGLQLSRADFYEKEITFQVSCSYGPGRYDPAYEEDGKDYPIGFVRWTAQRNFEAVLQMMASKRLLVPAMVTHRFPFAESEDAYKTLLEDSSALGIVLEYPREPAATRLMSRTVALRRFESAGSSQVVLGFLGAGNYAGRVLIPAFSKAGAELQILNNTGSIQGASVARRHGFAILSTDSNVVFESERVNTVVIATRHDTHADLAIRAIESGKHVFVEKPLALNIEALAAVRGMLERDVAASRVRQFCVGFNRRFAPAAVAMRTQLASWEGAKSLIYTVNAGAIPADHWTQGAQGGGRIVGECCHFIDLLRFLVGAPIRDWKVCAMARAGAPRDTLTITLRFEDGSIGTLHYFANGSRSFAKERIEVFAGGRTLQLDNFRRLRGYGLRVPAMRSWRPEKGQQQLVAAFVQRIKEGGEPPIPLTEIFEVMRVSILAQQAVDAD